MIKFSSFLYHVSEEFDLIIIITQMIIIIIIINPIRLRVGRLSKKKLHKNKQKIDKFLITTNNQQQQAES